MLSCVIFDLDGVIVSTDEFHYQGWQRLADEEGIYFDRHINERLRGVSRMESLAILLERATQSYTEAQKLAFADRKNGYYKTLIRSLTPADILPGALGIVQALKARGVKVAIGSSSRNTPAILKSVGLDHAFDAVVSGNEIKNTKPDPEVFLLAAQLCHTPPSACLVVEDAVAGVEAAIRAGMRVFAVGSAADDLRANARAPDLSSVPLETLLGA